MAQRCRVTHWQAKGLCRPAAWWGGWGGEGGGGCRATPESLWPPVLRFIHSCFAFSFCVIFDSCGRASFPLLHVVSVPPGHGPTLCHIWP